MSKSEHHAYLEQIRVRYGKAKRADKTRILDEFCAVSSLPQANCRPAKPPV